MSSSGSLLLFVLPLLLLLVQFLKNENVSAAVTDDIVQKSLDINTTVQPQNQMPSLSNSSSSTGQLKQKAPRARGLNGDFRVNAKSRLLLRCKVSGNPFPWVEWFRNGKRLRNNNRVKIQTRRRVSRLEIRRVKPSTDTGYYECRATNAVTKEPAVARTRVIVVSGRVWPPLRPSSSTSRQQQMQTTPTIGSQPSSRFPSRRPPNGVALLPTTAPNVHSPWYEQPCPRPHYCLNGGTCTYIKPLAEYYCRCAENYKGQRCENKDISMSLLRSTTTHTRHD